MATGAGYPAAVTRISLSLKKNGPAGGAVFISIMLVVMMAVAALDHDDLLVVTTMQSAIAMHVGASATIIAVMAVHSTFT